MKKITFILSLVSASLTVTAASAAVQNQNENVINLPAYTVIAPRYTEAEKTIAQSLEAFRNEAKPAVAVRTALPSLNVVAQTPAKDERSVAVAVKTSMQVRS